MADSSELKILGNTPKGVSRRKFVGGVIGGGAAVSSAAYLFESANVHGAAGAGEQLITLNINGRATRWPTS